MVFLCAPLQGCSFVAFSVTNAVALNDDQLYVGGEWPTAKLLVEKGQANPYRFRLFAQATTWKPGDLDREISDGAWRVVKVSTELLLKDRERGALPLPIEILEYLDSTALEGK